MEQRELPLVAVLEASQVLHGQRTSFANIGVCGTHKLSSSLQVNSRWNQLDPWSRSAIKAATEPRRFGEVVLLDHMIAIARMLHRSGKALEVAADSNGRWFIMLIP